MSCMKATEGFLHGQQNVCWQLRNQVEFKDIPDCTLRGEPFCFLDPPLESGMAIGKAEVLTRFGVDMLTTPALAISITGLPVDIANGRPRRPPQLRLPLSINITSTNLTRTEAQNSPLKTETRLYLLEKFKKCMRLETVLSCCQAQSRSRNARCTAGHQLRT